MTKHGVLDIIYLNNWYGNSPSQWAKLSLIFAVEIYGIKKVYDQIGTLLADMCLRSFTITYFVHFLIHVKYFKDLLESIPHYRKIVLALFLRKNDEKFLHECGFLKDDKSQLF